MLVRWLRQARPDAAGACSSRFGDLRRREEPLERRSDRLLSTAVDPGITTVCGSARRRTRAVGRSDFSKPHSVLVCSRGRTAIPEISLLSVHLTITSGNSSAIAKGLRGIGPILCSRRKSARTGAQKNRPDLRHLSGSRFLVLSG
jgi:hypothetical protein